MNLFDILACPNCKVKVTRSQDFLLCPQCAQKYPVIHGVPIMFPDGNQLEVVYQGELSKRSFYNPWVNRTILQSLMDDQVVVDVGAGNMELDDPNIIRMDITLTKYVDLVADVHALPFLPGSVDYIFSLAVFEHLRNPFEAAQSIYQTLKDGGYIYHECNFLCPYHGYPHHYFNASLQGMEQIFARFTHLRKGVATYQMPSFALDSVLRTYLGLSHAREYPHGQLIVEKLQQIIDMDLMSFDIYFNEAEAQYVAAGVYLSGLKQETPTSSLIPAVIRRAWEENPALRERFPTPVDLSTANNLMVWARQDGCKEYPEIAEYLRNIRRFNKRGDGAPWDRRAIRDLDLVEPLFGAIGYDPRIPVAEHSRRLMQSSPEAQAALVSPLRKLTARETYRSLLITLRQGGIIGLVIRFLRYLQKRTLRRK